jgi:hypothetical protein
MAERKSKKSLIDTTIPAFIKASLEVYRQEPAYGIPDLQPYTKSAEISENQ